jgi:hypothetical protein
MIKITLLALFSIGAFAQELDNNKKYLGFRHNHDGSAHQAFNKIKSFIKPVINKGRVNVYEITDPNFDIEKASPQVKAQFFKIEQSDLVMSPQSFDKNIYTNISPIKKVQKTINKLSVSSYTKYVTSLVTIGNRSKGAEASSYIITELQKLNLNPIETKYNIVSKIEGETSESIVVIGHMDTVRRTVGADDNASGASGVLELARVLKDKYQDIKPKRSIYFVLSEDEEDGLLGAKKFVKNLKSRGELKGIKLAINMDMIAYNQNGMVDLETAKNFEALALDFAKMAKTYTTLTPNLVLNPWGSDHVPFLDEGVPALLSIENWKTHTPCWHKSCDTLDTLNFDYAVEILKMNLAMILDKQN